MFPLHRFGLIHLLLVFAALAVLGCTPDLEKNEQFQTEKAKLERVDGEQSQTAKDVGLIREELKNLSRNVEKHLGTKDAGGMPPETLNGIQQRLSALENAVKALQTQSSAAKATERTAPPAAAAGAAKTAKLTVKESGLPEAGAKPATGMGAKPATGRTRSATPANGTKTQVSVVAKTPGASGKPARKASAGSAGSAQSSAASSSSSSGGHYYDVSRDDSIQAIASRFNRSPESILKANHLPPNARLFIGQSIYIPAR